MEQGFSEIEYLQRYLSFLVFTEMMEKPLYHLLFYNIPKLLNEKFKQ